MFHDRHSRHLFRLLFVLALALVTAGLYYSTHFAAPSGLKVKIPIPQQEDWIDHGIVIPAGELGEWDFQLWGGFAASAIKHEGIYYLYYQGADGYRVEPDETVTGRTIGVATSENGINFTKYTANPILNWSPFEAGEEGAVSSGVALNPSGEIAIIYGANTLESSRTVNADGRLALSPDGLNFVDQGIVLNRLDRSLWGSGDEIFPIAAIQIDGSWLVYYLPNGRLRRRHVGVAWGTDPHNLSSSSPLRHGLSHIEAWGTASMANVGADVHALFLNNVQSRQISVRLFELDRPQQVSEVVAAYQFEGVTQATFLLDETRRTWFMYYRKDNGYGVMTAPTGEADHSPPESPHSLQAIPIDHRQIELTWSGALDPETGVAAYQIWRDGLLITTALGHRYVDENLQAQTTYQYELVPLNLHGFAGRSGAAISVSTLPDQAPPQLVAIDVGAEADTLILHFDEQLTPSSAESVTNYGLDHDAIVLEAKLEAGHYSVVVKTTPLTAGEQYELTIQHLADRQIPANVMTETVTVPYLFLGLDGLVAAWSFERQAIPLAPTADYRLAAVFSPLSPVGPQIGAGAIGQALQLNGENDHFVVVNPNGLLGSVSQTISSWLSPATLPLASNVSNQFATILNRGATQIFYDSRGRFGARLQLQNGETVALQSMPQPAGNWYHLAVVIDIEAGTLQLYVNGEEIESSPAAFDDIDGNNNAPLYIGTADPLPERYDNRWHGRLDEIWFFNRALTAAEISHLFMLGSTASD